jgi:hypothetical protein
MNTEYCSFGDDMNCCPTSIGFKSFSKESKDNWSCNFSTVSSVSPYSLEYFSRASAKYRRIKSPKESSNCLNVVCSNCG